MQSCFFVKVLPRQPHGCSKYAPLLLMSPRFSPNPAGSLPTPASRPARSPPVPCPQVRMVIPDFLTLSAPRDGCHGVYGCSASYRYVRFPCHVVSAKAGILPTQTLSGFVLPGPMEIAGRLADAPAQRIILIPRSLLLLMTRVNWPCAFHSSCCPCALSVHPIRYSGKGHARSRQAVVQHRTLILIRQQVARLS